jgi:hypothetical protein
LSHQAPLTPTVLPLRSSPSVYSVVYFKHKHLQFGRSLGHYGEEEVMGSFEMVGAIARMYIKMAPLLLSKNVKNKI